MGTEESGFRGSSKDGWLLLHVRRYYSYTYKRGRICTNLALTFSFPHTFLHLPSPGMEGGSFTEGHLSQKRNGGKVGSRSFSNLCENIFSYQAYFRLTFLGRECCSYGLMGPKHKKAIFIHCVPKMPRNIIVRVMPQIEFTWTRLDEVHITNDGLLRILVYIYLLADLSVLAQK